MELTFFDSTCQFGRQPAGGYKAAPTTDDLLTMMDGCGIARALVHHVAQVEGAPDFGNRLLIDQIRLANEKQPQQPWPPRLVACWTILPPQTHEMPDPDIFFAQMKRDDVSALLAFPLKHRYLLNRVTFGSFLDEISRRRIPLVLPLAQMPDEWAAIYRLLAEYPALTCVITGTGVWGSDRSFRPLLEAYPNLYLETSMLAMNDQVVEALVRDYGPRRLVFGSGFPVREPLSALLQLRHAELADDDKQLIASGNLTRLLGEVIL